MQAYSDKSESDPYALPDVEVWRHRHTSNPGAEFDDCPGAEACLGEGWYWWFCFPGCMPDSDAHGPFETKEEALEDARGVED